jgi:hypothetical protein
MNEEESALLPLWFRICREPLCGKRIGFHPERKSISGALIPLEPTSGSRHLCPNSQYQRRVNKAEQQQNEEPSKEEVGAYFNQERIVLDVMAAIVDANSKLDTFYLKLERVPKTEGQSTLT